MEQNKKPIVVNLFGAPGAGKSTGAASVFRDLKLNDVNVELVTEFAKDKVYEETVEVWNNQLYIAGKQSFRLSKLRDKVDVIVTDSPLLLSAFYNADPVLGRDFDNTVKNVFNSYNNKNYFLYRVKPYNPSGRFQTEKESDALGDKLHIYLEKNEVNFKVKAGSKETYDAIVEEVMIELAKNKWASKDN